MKINNISGINMASASSNTRYGKRDDSLLILIEKGSTISGKFTNNSFKSAPVITAKAHLKRCAGKEIILIINAGNANAGTGKKGAKDVLSCCKSVGKEMGIDPECVLPFSTGVIGEHLKTDEYIGAFVKASKRLKSNNWKQAARSILTTDTKPKLISRMIKNGSERIAMTGFAKGSGMIRPDFATLLSFVFIDAKINRPLLDKIHSEALSESFNRITVDGDTSPNDSSVLVASGRTKSPIKRGTPIERKIRSGVIEIYKELADLLIKDAEGATKKITIKVVQAKTEEQAKSVAFTVAESPLVKTAMFGNDANWGRILSAIGRSPEVNDVSKTSIHLNGVPLAKNGNLHPQHSESKASKAIMKKNLDVTVKLGLGKSTFSVITSDFSEDYLLINSDYRS
ncbi:bifunctional glutamate N-acetyltransferase/amino-acid acetyltransferase ArgJ [Gammaproteobacteria bacterium]|nr:bifunctional glutamate N-acetyltransferase/amino-acid acetyltransferase ArgJ [Gammaproteobacteria bacterium]